MAQTSSTNKLTAALLAACIVMLPLALDEWTASRATAAQIHAAAFRTESAARLAAQAAQLRRIAQGGIATPEDAALAQVCCAVLYTDLCLQRGEDGQ